MTAQRPHVVLLPGILGDRAEMAPLAERLGAHGSVDAVDLPAGREGLREIALALARGLRRRPVGPGGAPPTVVIGASFGGLVARALLGMGHPGLIQVVTIGARWGPPPRPALLRAAAALAEQAPPGAFQAAHRARLRARLRGEGIAEGPQRALLAAPLTAAEWARRLRAVAAWGLPAPGPEVRALWGEHDQERALAGPDATAPGAAGLPGGHRPHLSHPDQTSDVVERLIRAGRR